MQCTRRRHLSTLLGASLLAMLFACGNGSSSSSGAGVVEPEPESAASAERVEREQALRRLRARQEAACEQVSHVITRCAIEDARATLPPEEFAKLDVEKLAPAHSAEFVEQCTSSDMSVRQVEVFEQCMDKQSQCAVFLDCLDQARPQPSPSQP